MNLNLLCREHEFARDGEHRRAGRSQAQKADVSKSLHHDEGSHNPEHLLVSSSHCHLQQPGFGCVQTASRYDEYSPGLQRGETQIALNE